MQNETFVDVKNLTRWYGPTCAVDDVSFKLKRGEVLGFLGLNGAGKSTTMNIITGNLAPSRGEVLIHGIDIFNRPTAAKQHIGFLPEQPPVYKNFCVDEYLQFCGKIKLVPKPKLAAAIDMAKQRCGLQDVGHRLIGNLSKGYQQRVGIAQAIIHSPNVIILDEPTVGLDPVQINEIRQLIRELGKEHSVILSSHILPEIQSTCDRVQIINRGKLVYHDDLISLNRHHENNCLVVKFDNPPIARDLEALHQVSDVEMLDQNRFKIYFESDDSPAKTIIQASVTNHWELTEIAPLQKTLEQIFVDIVSENNAEEEQVA